ncbi:MAG: ATP-binding cassette domain-containing protein, partial [Phycisphaeraceae bacterium]
ALPSGALTIRNLTFAYATSTQPVLSEINIHITAGQTLALVGPSGAGKSTLMALLLRLYDYEQGEILFDDREIRSLPRQFVRSNLGVVMQEPFLFAKSLGENIRHGKSTAMENDVQEAAAAAQIHATIATFDKKYDTVIGERGVNLSGGQRQRVAIARAIVRDPAILILDDALSAVDSQTEAQILGALHTRRGKRTTILIAHRLSTLMQADQILVLDKGRVVQQGTHETLRGAEGLYRRLWRIQSEVEEDLEREMSNT